MANKSQESVFQNDIINQMVANGWQLGSPDGYNRELALYEEDVLGFVKETQDEQWQKYCKLYPQNPEKHFLERVATQLNKVDPNAANRELRTFGTLGVLRHELRDRGTRFKLCQFKPEHDLNPDTLARYERTACESFRSWFTARTPVKSICLRPARRPNRYASIWCCSSTVYRSPPWS